MDRWKAFRVLKSVHARLGLGKSELAALEAHLTVLPKGLVDRTGLTMSYMSAAAVRKRANCMSEKTFQRAEKRLEEAGLVHRRLSANGRRFPVIVGGKVVDAYGIDLSPFFRRIEELEEMAQELTAQEETLKARRTQISCRLQELRRAFANASEAVMSRIDALARDARRRLRRRIASPSMLDAIEAEVRDLEADLSQAAHAPCPAGEECRPGAAGDAVFTAVNPDNPDVDAGQNVRHIESQKKQNQKEGGRLSGLEYDPAKIQRIWKNVRALSELYPEVPKRDHQMARILFEFSSYIGIGPDLVPKALAALGWDGLIVTLNYLAEKIDEIGKPQGYLRTMLRKYENGEVIAGGRVRRPSSHGLPFLPSPV